MKKLIILAVFAAIAPALKGASESDKPTPNTVFIIHDEDLLKTNHAYIMGCDAGRFEVRVGIFAIVGNRIKLAAEYRTPSQDITEFSPDRAISFALYIKSVLAHLAQRYPICIQKACFGAPGPTTESRDFIDAPLAPYAVDGSEIRKQTGLKETLVINDFETVGLGMEAVDQTEVTTLLAGTPRPRGTRLVIGAGNGLGSGLMVWDNKYQSHMPAPLNYSFVDFSPQSEQEFAYNQYLNKEGMNTWGRVLGSSSGIVGMYNFLHEPETQLYRTADYQEIFSRRDTDPACKVAVDFYMKQYVRLVRNAAYAQAPHGGLYITNAIAEKNPTLFTDGTFAKEFLNTHNTYLLKYLEEIPVYLVTSPNLKLYGAGQYGFVYLKD